MHLQKNYTEENDKIFCIYLYLIGECYKSGKILIHKVKDANKYVLSINVNWIC
jgi:hypothetical protein